jgi:hypothetical protein
MDTSWDSVRKVADVRGSESCKNLGLRCLSRPRSHLGFRYRSLSQVWGINRLDREGDHR